VAEPGSKNKLSKRKIAQYLKNPDFKKVYDHGKAIADRLGRTTTPDNFNPVLVEFYETVGYLPDPIINYLMLLGWSHADGKSEEFTRDEMVRLFTLDRVNKAASSLDTKKLFAFQERAMQALPVSEKVERALPFLVRAELVPDPVPAGVRATVEQIVAAAGPRLKVAGDVLDYDDFFRPDEQVQYDAKAAEKHLRKPPGSEWIAGLREIVATADPFEADTLREKVEAFTQARGAKPIPVSQTLRVAVTGKEVGFGTYETLSILGRERCLNRIDRAVTKQ
jgi:glutamyl-tRNA synthetase